MTDAKAKTNGHCEVDVEDMDQKKRVKELTVNSKAFREVLGEMIEAHVSQKSQFGSELDKPHIFSGKPLPLDDISGVASLSYGNAERIWRCKLASLHRLIDIRGWSHGITNHLTVINPDDGHMLINPYGLLFHEITAASLIKLTLDGKIVDPGTSRYGVNPAGYILHSVIHAARPDIRCVIHVHMPTSIAVAATSHGLLPICQEAFILGDVSYHDYSGILVDDAERESLGKDLGPKNNVMFLRNHGIVCCGQTIEEAYYNLNYTVLACEAQVKAMAAGLDNLLVIPEHVFQKKKAQFEEFALQREKEAGGRLMRPDVLLFEAYMRTMDSVGHRTGYDYHKLPSQGSCQLPRPQP